MIMGHVMNFREMKEPKPLLAAFDPDGYDHDADLHDVPWRRIDWHGDILSDDGASTADFARDDLDVIICGIPGQDHDVCAGIARLKDGRYISWESNCEPSGCGFSADSVGGGAEIWISKTFARALKFISENSREMLEFRGTMTTWKDSDHASICFQRDGGHAWLERFESVSLYVIPAVTIDNDEGIFTLLSSVLWITGNVFKEPAVMGLVKGLVGLTEPTLGVFADGVWTFL